MELSRLVRSAVSNLEGRKLLQQDVGMLLGVSPAARDVLQGDLRIASIYDLAVSNVFNAARRLVDASGVVESEALHHDFVPGDSLWPSPSEIRPSTVGSEPLDTLVFTPSSREASDEMAERIESALDIGSIRELALWPPFQNARHILLSTFNAARLDEDDPEAPADLLPKTGNYATERVYYDSVYLTEMHDDADLATLGASDALVDIDTDAGTWYNRPAYGVHLRTEQAWYAQGVTLGQLLHSVALAPGESTRIAVIDWTRHTLGVGSESIDEQEAMAASSFQRRNITEVTNAIARETQSGSSAMQSTSLSSSRASTASGSFLVASAGGSSSMGFNRGVATNVSRSSGTRHLSARTSQDIAARTEQQATSARSRRASVIKETFEQESEKISTRVITNYNHMHALSIQYYEVVQSYRVVTRANRFERVLFIPIKPITFDPDDILRYRHILAWAAMDRPTRERIESFEKKVISTWTPLNNDTSGAPDGAREEKTEVLKGPRGFAGGRLERLTFHDDLPDGRIRSVRVTLSSGGAFSYPVERAVDSGLLEVDFDPAIRIDQLERIELVLNQDVESGSGELYESSQLEYEVRLPKESLYFRQPVKWRGQVYTLPDQPIIHTVQAGEGAVEIAQKYDVSVKEIAEANGNLNLALLHAGMQLVVPKSAVPPSEGEAKGERLVPVLQVETRPADYSLIDHLNDNALHYSQAIWASGDSFLLNRVLARYNVDDPYPDPHREMDGDPNLRPLASSVDPTPVAMTGNYLGFVWHFESEDARQNWLADNGLEEGGERVETMVSLPSGGVFAEAVLGRFNAAEKLDLSRFWNWQDSPIPIQAPEIAPVEAGSRARGVSTDIGQLGAPVAQLPALQQLPDPTGAGAILNALTTSNMFRDMSGQAETAAALQKSVELAASGSEHAAEQAGRAMEALMQHQQAMASIAADVAKNATPTGGGKSKLAGQSVSKIGAVLNSANKDGADQTTS